ncbi:preprotein translocase subunit SecE [Desulfonatronum thioautotrophicum]|uniref:preprotein translocase subunit SecE n=1 Tax=Desulfonatronum thioautotrophicum TaxID=617001 RepID=UPI0005EB2613|nr:preprotein translocase subunit SecE [Desulfonatronum thioautotrophicum]
MAKQQSGEDKKVPAGRFDIKEKAVQFKDFFEKSKLELKKVTWPTRKETQATCMAVVVLVIIMSLFLGLVDLALAKIVEVILY